MLRLYVPKLNRELIYIYSKDNIDIIKPKLDVQLKKLKTHQLHKLNNVKKLNAERLKNRLIRGDDCYVCIYDNKVISYHWVQYNGKHLLQQSGQVYDLKNEACIYHVRVKSEYQKRRISSFVYSRIIDDNLRKGIIKIWIYTNYNNIANQRSLEKIGFFKDELIYSFRFDRKFYRLYAKKIK